MTVQHVATTTPMRRALRSTGASPLGWVPRLLALFIAIVSVAGVSTGVTATPTEPNTIVSSSPSDGSVLDTAPVAIILNFAQEIGEATTVALNCDAEIVTLPPPTFADDGLSLTIDLSGATIPSSSTCSIRWTSFDPDGVQSGDGIITFNVSVGSAPATTTAPGTDGGTDTPTATVPPTDTPTSTDTTTNAVPINDFSVSGTGDGAVWLGRFLSTTSIAILFGALVVITMAWPEGVEYLITVRFLRMVWIVAMVSTFLFTAAAAGAVSGEGFSAGLSPGTWGELVDGGWAGIAVLARLLLVAASGVVAFRPDLVIDPTTQLGALGVVGLATAMIGVTRTVGDLAFVGILVGITHAIAMAIWIGGVVFVARIVLAGPGEEDLVHAVRGFSRISMGAMIVTVASGVILLVRLDGGDLFSSGHGRVVLLKAVIVAVLVFLAITARQVVGQRLARAHEMGVREADRLRRAFGTEAAIGALVLAVSAWLLAFTPNSIDDTPQIPYAVNAPVTIEVAGQEALDLIVRLTDDRVGFIGMEVDVRSPEEGLSNLQVIFTAPPSSTVIGQIIQPVPLTGRGVAVRLASNGLPFAVAGEWTMQITANTPLGPVESELLPFIVFEADGTAATTTLAIPQASLVPVTTPAPAGG